MDKTLEVIMVASMLIIASVVIVSLLQGQTQNVSNFANDQTDSGDCGLLRVRYESALNCGGDTVETDAAEGIENDASNQDCGWAGSANGEEFCD